MRIACPTCNAAYEVAAERLAPGRDVRCARCGTLWAPVAAEDAAPPLPLPAEPERPAPPPEPVLPEPPPAEPPAEAPILEPEVAGPARRPLFVPVAPHPTPNLVDEAPDSPPRAGRRLLAAAWVGSLVVVLAVAWATWAFRAEIVLLWPASGRLYGWLGYGAR